MTTTAGTTSTSLMRIRMQQLFKNSPGTSLNWIKNIPWSDCKLNSELVNLQKWSVFGSYFDKYSIDQKTRSEIVSAHFRATLAQFLYGESAAVNILNQTIELTEDTEIQQLCRSQADEEQAHHDVLLRFFTHIGGDIPEINPHFDCAVKDISRAKLANLKIIGLQGLLEPAAATFLRFAIESGLSPTLGYILKNILADEERHIAFGMLCIKDSYSKLSLTEQGVCEDFIFNICRNMMSFACNEINLSHFLKPDDSRRFNEYVWHDPDMVAGRKFFFSRCSLALAQMNLLSANLTHRLRGLEFM